ncbi:hypothetical protein [Spirillospora sp. NPDC048824]|uniref:hypothetical protein n=1 Tax=Spirillospora sp. NPDC048824 TaxID=3364526 RepID=UPI00371081F9
MTTAPNLVVTGDVGLSQKLRETRRFPAVFDVASATELRELSRSGRVRPPAAFLFTPGFDEDLPETRVPDLANGLAASGFTVLVHGYFSERGDRFVEDVVTSARPMSLSDLLAALGVARPASPAPPGQETAPDLHPEPPPEPWESQEVEEVEEVQVQEFHVREFPVVRDAREPLETPPGYGAPEFTDALEESAHPAAAPPTVMEQLLEPAWEEAPPEPEPETWAQPAPEPETWTQPAPEPDQAVWPPQAAPEPEIWTQPPPEPDQAVWPQTMPASPAPHPRDRGRSGRRSVLMALVVVVVIAVGIGAAGLIGGDWADEGRTQAGSSPEPSPAKAAQPSESAKPQSSQAAPPPASKSPEVPSSAPTAVRPVKQYTPGALRIVDGRISIQVTWQDRSAGRASHYVVGGPTGRPPTTLASTPPGTARVEVTALNPGVDYCLTVVAVVDVDRVAQAKPVCTHRVKRSG